VSLAAISLSFSTTIRVSFFSSTIREKNSQIFTGSMLFPILLDNNCQSCSFSIQFFNQLYHSHFNIHGTGFNVPVLDFFIPSSIKHVHGTRFNVPVLDVLLHSFSFNTFPSYGSQYVNLYLQRSVTPKFKRASTSPSIFQFSLRFTPTVKQESSTALSHSELV